MLLMATLPKTVRIVEVGPRDGLQNEAKIVSTDKKAEFIKMLAEAGLREIEVTSFVHPKWVPQLADGENLIKQLKTEAGARYSALVPNMKGMERAIARGMRRIAVYTSASERINIKTIHVGTKR